MDGPGGERNARDVAVPRQRPALREGRRTGIVSNLRRHRLGSQEQPKLNNRPRCVKNAPGVKFFLLGWKIYLNSRQLHDATHQPTNQMTTTTIKTAAANGNNGYADFPFISAEIKAELKRIGFTTQPSSSLYHNGVRVYAPKAIRAGRPS